MGVPASASNHKAAVALWHSARELRTGDPADLYLLGRLGRSVFSPALRQLENCRHPGQPGQSSHALLARFSSAAGALTGVQRIYVTPNGHRAPFDPKRLSLGPLEKGGAVRLSHFQHVIGIAEGVETALAATILFGVPCWATLGWARLASWEPPRLAREVHIFADNDATGAGQLAATRLKERIEQRVKARVVVPPQADTDWNDVLLYRLGHG